MKNKFEHLLLSTLLGIAILLGLSFWLDLIFRFNLFFKEHWDELARLQASHTPIAHGFYVSIGFAVCLFILGLYLIYMPSIKKLHKQKIVTSVPATISTPKTTTYEETQKNPPAETPILLTRPPKLNLPKNMAQIVAQRQTQTTNQTSQQKTSITNDGTSNPYNPMLAEIFSENGYVVKPNPTISGFTSNLVAIGPNEVFWIGAVDVTPDKLNSAITKLRDVFETTLEDIPINIRAFIIDNLNQYQSNDEISVFKSLDELKKFVSENPSDTIPEEEVDSFGSYSEYIDTIIQYIKNI